MWVQQFVKRCSFALSLILYPESMYMYTMWPQLYFRTRFPVFFFFFFFTFFSLLSLFLYTLPPTFFLSLTLFFSSVLCLLSSTLFRAKLTSAEARFNRRFTQYYSSESSRLRCFFFHSRCILAIAQIYFLFLSFSLSSFVVFFLFGKSKKNLG